MLFKLGGIGGVALGFIMGGENMYYFIVGGIVLFMLSCIEKETVYGDEVLWVVLALYFLICVTFILGVPIALFFFLRYKFGFWWGVGAAVVSCIAFAALFPNLAKEKEKPQKTAAAASPAPAQKKGPGLLSLLFWGWVSSALDGEVDTSYMDSLHSDEEYERQAAYAREIEQQNRRRSEEEARARKQREADERYRKEKERQHYDYLYRKAKQTDPNEYYINTRKYKYRSGR